MFVREDWTLFRNLTTISQQAGVPMHKLRGVVLKELVDNALDANPGKKCKVWATGDHMYSVEDDGPGIPGSPKEIASLFSIKRPLTSSKILRRPSRGALGNGIRVICGVILASGGTISVSTRQTKIDLLLHDDGNTEVANIQPSSVRGTRIDITFGKSLPKDPKRSDLDWAETANNFSFAKVYEGKTSAWWYDSDSFYELIQAAGDNSIAELVVEFEGVKGPKIAGAILGLPPKCNEFNREMAELLLGRLRACQPDQISPKKIGRMLDTEEPDVPYSRKFGTVELTPGRGKHAAILPFCVEAYAKKHPDQGPESSDMIIGMVNGTPITDELKIRREDKHRVAIYGCGVNHYIDRVSAVKMILVINITTPYMPITTQGKAPDFLKYLGEIFLVVRKASRRLKSTVNQGVQQTDILAKNIKQAIAKVSASGTYRFSLRQLFYGIRPYVMESSPENPQLDYNYFARWISQYENERGEIKGMYRDPRGTLYHPHLGLTIPIGTISVEEYERPAWTFNKILYIEKEGLFEVLKQVKFPERYDCALLSSKGFASRAVRDLIDLLGDEGEEIHVFAIHDADGPGTVIYEALVGDTIARRGRKVQVHNLGIEPWEGVAMGLQVETFPQRKSKTPVADYIERHQKDYDIEFPSDAPVSEDMDGDEWADWLQTNRVELNAMTSPQFVQWIEAKFDKLDAKKVVPPSDVLLKTVQDMTLRRVRQRLVNDILAQQNIDKLVEMEMKNKKFNVAGLDNIVKDELDTTPTQQWTAPLEKLAEKMASKK